MIYVGLNGAGEITALGWEIEQLAPGLKVLGLSAYPVDAEGVEIPHLRSDRSVEGAAGFRMGGRTYRKGQVWPFLR